MNKLTHIRTIRVTTGFDCNCKCPYCTQRTTHIDKRLDWGSSQINSLYQLLKTPVIIQKGTLSIEIEGGEPLLHPEIIKQTVKLCDQMNNDEREVVYSIVSNCQMLNKDREIIEWLKERKSAFQILVSFDELYKNPRNLTDDTYEYIKSCAPIPPFATYVVDGVDKIDEAKRNVEYLNSKGIIPLISWNFFKYKEMNDFSVRKRALQLLKETDNANFRDGRFSGDIPKCGWIGISEKGKLYPCYHAAFGVADLEKGKQFIESHCKDCEIRNFCKQCIVRKSLYGENICGIMKVRYAYQNCKEVT